MLGSQARFVSAPQLRDKKINIKINYIISAGVTTIAATPLIFTLHTYIQAQSAIEQVASLTQDLAQQRMIQLSQSAYNEQRHNNLSASHDQLKNDLESRMGVLENRVKLLQGRYQ